MRALEKKIRETVMALYGRYPKAITPFFCALNDSRLTFGTGSSNPDKVFFGKVYGSVVMNSSTPDYIQTLIKNSVDMYLSGDYVAGYTGPKYLPFAFPDICFESLVMSETHGSKCAFIGYAVAL